MKKYTLSIFMLVLFFSGCGDNPIENEVSKVHLLKKTYTSPENYVEFFYSENQLVKKEGIHNGETFASYNLSYNKNGLLIKQIYFPTGAGIIISNTRTYEYDDNNILIKSYSYYDTENDVNELKAYNLYEYENNKLTKISTYGLDDDLRGYRTFKYDSRENIIEYATYNGNNELLHLDEYEYDNQPNPLIVDNTYMLAFSLSKNNITKRINTYYTVTPPETNISESSYTYNNIGYPDKCTTGNTITYYEYK